jgi:hypothetical protein
MRQIKPNEPQLGVLNSRNESVPYSERDACVSGKFLHSTINIPFVAFAKPRLLPVQIPIMNLNQILRSGPDLAFRSELNFNLFLHHSSLYRYMALSAAVHLLPQEKCSPCKTKSP